MSSLVGRLGAAKQFLVDRIKSENNLLKLAVTQLNQAARDLDEVKQEIFRLRKELELKRKLVSCSDPDSQTFLNWPKDSDFTVIAANLGRDPFWLRRYCRARDGYQG